MDRRRKGEQGETRGPTETDIPEFAWPARFEYTYRFGLLGWILEGHARLREALHRAWPAAIRRGLSVTERIAEIPFALRSLPLPPGSRILDVGSRWSPIPLHLAALGYRTVATDVAAFPVAGAGPEFVLADMRRPPFRAASFDGGVIVSTLEHVGLGFYDPRRGREDDARLMECLLELLKPGGLLVLTTPYGRPGEDRHQRVYDCERLRRVTEGWDKKEMRYWIRRGRRWEETTEDEAAGSTSIPETSAVAMLVLRRP